MTTVNHWLHELYFRPLWELPKGEVAIGIKQYGLVIWCGTCKCWVKA